MKIYIVANTGIEHHSIISLHLSKEEAQQNADFVAARENEREEYDVRDLNQITFRRRFVRVGNVWHEQTQGRLKGDPWPEWEPLNEERVHDKIVVEEHESSALTFQEQCDAINEWQANSRVHPMTCGENSNHPNLIPYYCFNWKGIGLKCVASDCDWSQKPNHS